MSVATNNGKAPRFVQNPDTGFIADRLRKTAVGETVTYAEMTMIIGRNVQAEARSVLASARRACERDGIAFEAVTNVGVKRLDDAGKVRACRSALGAIHKRALRVGRRLATVAADGLSEGGKVEFNAASTLASVVSLMSSPNGFARIEKRIQEKQDRLPLAATLQEFLK